MSEEAAEGDDSVLTDFLEACLADRERGVVRSLDDYLRQFPGHASVIAREFLSLEEGAFAMEPRADHPGSSAPPAIESADAAGDHIGHYRLIDEIGRGGQGIVYLAEDTRLQRRVALKVLKGIGSLSEDSLARFRREAQAASRLAHSGICSVYEAALDGNVPYIAMRLVEGESLAASIAAAKSRGEAPANLVQLIEKVARALHAAHEAGVVHRDMKPGNVMVTPEGEAVIMDFGLAYLEDDRLPTLTQTGEFFGTPAYMSPEQLLAERVRVDRRTDVWSLGVMLYECVTLQRPFESPTREGLYQAIQTREPADPHHLNPAVPKEMAVVIETALEKDRDRRYQTALDLAEELRRVRMREPILAKPAGRLVRLQRWAQRNPGLATAVAGIFAALGIGLTAALLLLGKSERERVAKEKAFNEKQAALIDYDRLGDSSRLQRLQTEADGLGPSEPANLSAIRAWVHQAEALAGRLQEHEAALELMRKSGRRVMPESRPGETGPADSRPVWQFADDALKFKHDTTAKLVEDLMAFVDPTTGLMADVRGRLAFAETVELETIGKYETNWAEAVHSIADETECPKYHGLKIKAQIGLIPIGKDPASGLWEFVHLQTAAPGNPIPRRGSDGRIVVTEEMGLVFVLVPGGTFMMGAVKPGGGRSLTSPNVDPEADPNEGPVTEVRLDPFFLSKYEMTQGQWLRPVGKNPSQYGPGVEYEGREPMDLRHPLEHVTWTECDSWLGRLGLMLPTEAQWEYGARGGTTTPRWTGTGTGGLAEAANLLDASLKEEGGPAHLKYETWNDGYPAHAPVGSFAANSFGLHDVLGNVLEWCRDRYDTYQVKPRPGDGLRDSSTSRSRVTRGASYGNGAWAARSAMRVKTLPEQRSENLGVRPARPCRQD